MNRSVAVSASPRVRDRLRSAGDGARAVVHAGRHAVYVDLDGWCLGVVGRDAAQVPNALRVAAPDLAGFEGATGSSTGVAASVAASVTAFVAGGVLHLGGTPLRIGRLVEVRVPRLEPRGVPLDHLAAVPSEVAGFARECGLSPEAHRPLGPDDVARLVGRGGGLTPLGDDLLCGWLAAQRAAGRATPAVDAAVLALLASTTLLSATLLDCALHGEVVPEFADYLAAVATSDEPHRAAALAAVGHTSGAGLLLGALLARTELDHANGVAA